MVQGTLRSAAWCVVALWLFAGCEPERSSGPASTRRSEAAEASPTLAARLEAASSLEVRVRGGEEAPRAALVLLHGYGAPGDDLVALGESWELGDDVLRVYPVAPLAVARTGRAWWTIEFDARPPGPADLRGEQPEGLVEAAAAVRRILDALPVARDRVVVAGFSQGAMLSMEVAVQSDSELAGVVLMSGAYLDAERWRPALPSVPVFVSHGDSDPLLQRSPMEALVRDLRAAGAEVTWVGFLGGHAIPPQVSSEARRFVHARLR